MIEVMAQVKGPSIDWASLSPLLAPLGGGLVVLMAGLARGRAVQRHLMPVLTLIALAAGIVFSVWQWEPGDAGTLVAGALTDDTLALGIAVIVFVTGIATVFLSWRSTVVDSAGGGEYYSMLLFSIAGMVMLVMAENLVTLFIGFELLSIPLYVLCAARVREVRSLESGLKYLIIGSVGSATLLYGLALIYGATGSTDFCSHRRRGRHGGRRRRPAAPDRNRVGGYGLRVQGVGGAVPPVDARRLPGRPHAGNRVHGGRDQGGGVRCLPAVLLRTARRRAGQLGTGARSPRGDHDHHRQRRRDRAAVDEAPAGVVGRRSGRVSAWPASSSAPSSGSRRRSSTWRCTC